MNKYTIEIINVCSTWHGNIRDIPNSSLDVPLFLIDQSILIHTLKKFNISRQKQKNSTLIWTENQDLVAVNLTVLQKT